jgi:PAS domain S-box-containing protein
MPVAVALGETVFDANGKPIDYRIVDVNPAYERLTGQRAADAVGKLVSELNPQMRRELVERAGLVAVSGEPVEFEGHDTASDRFSRIRLSRIGPTLVMAMIEDVTEARRAEAALRERSAFVETILASAGDGLIVYDRDLRVSVWNPAMEELTGLTADQVLGGGVLDLFPEVMAAGVGEDLRGALAGEPPTYRELEYEIPRTGRTGWVVQTNRPRRNDRGEIVGVVSSVHDITAEHEADDARQRSEEQFRAIFDSVGDAVAIYEPDGAFVEVNRMLCERLGYSRDELLTMTVKDIDAPESAALVPGRVEAITQEGVARFEAIHLRRDGTRIPTEIVSRKIEFRGHTAILTVQRDITERKRAEEAIRSQALFMQELLNAIPIPINAKGRDGRIQLCNEAFAAAGNLTREQVVGKKLTELPMPEATALAARDEALLADGTPQVYEAFMPTPGGGMRRHVLSKSPLRAPDGEITGIVTAALDIGDRYEAEQALKRSEERFRTLFEHAGDAIFISDLFGRFIEVNQTACERLGYRGEELLRMSVPDIDTLDAAALGNRLESMRGAGSAVMETMHVRHDGTLVPTEMISTMIELGGQPAVLSIARDVSDRKKAEAERAILEAQLRQSHKMEGIGQLAGGIAHDFNNLLTVISGFASLALDDLDSGQDAHEDIRQVEHAADRASTLTRQLLAFARRTVLQPEVVDLAAAVHNLEPMLRRIMGEDVSLLTVTPPLPATVLADPGQIEQVIVNLAVNARDAMPDGGVLTIETGQTDLDEGEALAHALAAPGRYVTLTVVDTGVGMSDETLSHAFEPFYTTKEPGKGTGLGLATVYGIVQQSGGGVTARSEPGRGSVFIVLLPLVDTAPTAQAEHHRAPDVSVTRSGAILLVEDDDAVRGFATRVLEQAGYRVLTAGGGTAALEVAQGQTIDLLLTDVVMPKMSGRDVADRIALVAPDARVLFVSGHDEKTIVRRGVLEPNVRYLAKPFTPEALIGAVEAALAAPPAHDRKGSRRAAKQPT